MAKGWTLVGTNAFEFGKTETKRDRVKQEQRNARMIKNAVRPKYEELSKESLNAAVAKEQYKTQLIEALEQGRLKSKRLIAEAKKYKEPVAE